MNAHVILAGLLLAFAPTAAATWDAEALLGEGGSDCSGLVDANCGVGPGFCHVYVRHAACLVFT